MRRIPSPGSFRCLLHEGKGRVCYGNDNIASVLCGQSMTRPGGRDKRQEDKWSEASCLRKQHAGSASSRITTIRSEVSNHYITSPLNHLVSNHYITSPPYNKQWSNRPVIMRVPSVSCHYIEDQTYTSATFDRHCLISFD